MAWHLIGRAVQGARQFLQRSKAAAPKAPPPKQVPKKPTSSTQKAAEDAKAKARQKADDMKQELKDNNLGVKGENVHETGAPTPTGTNSNSNYNPALGRSLGSDKDGPSL